MKLKRHAKKAIDYILDQDEKELLTTRKQMGRKPHPDYEGLAKRMVIAVNLVSHQQTVTFAQEMAHEKEKVTHKSTELNT